MSVLISVHYALTAVQATLRNKLSLRADGLSARPIAQEDEATVRELAALGSVHLEERRNEETSEPALYAWRLT